MRHVSALLFVVIVVGMIGSGGCCRPMCRPCPSPCDVVVVHRVDPATTPRVMPVEAAESVSAKAAPSTKSEGLFIRYFDVKDLGVGSGKVLMHDIRTQILPEVWEQEPDAGMDVRNHILIMRAPVELLNATETWLGKMRSEIDRVGADLAARQKRHVRRATREASKTSLVVQIHTIADLTAGEAANDLDVHLAGPEEEPTRIRRGMGIPMILLLSGIQSARISGEWPWSEEAGIRPTGPHALVVKAEPAFQKALDRYLAGLREEFGAGLADVPEPKEPIRAQPPSQDQDD